MRILFIEDNEARIKLFESWLPSDIRGSFARSAGTAMKILELDAGEVYAGIALDHDLVEHVRIESERQLSTTNLLPTIVRCIPSHVPVLVHSMNFGGSRRIERTLVAHGFGVTRKPFAGLDRDCFLDWIEEVRAEAER